jgi:peptidyl-dipeptidase Dcp
MPAHNENIPESQNPFFTGYATPHGEPPFNLIKDSHFKPAVIEGIRLQQEAINSIADNVVQPSFRNTIEAMEFSAPMLTAVNNVFGNLNAANTNETLQKLAQELAPELSRNYDAIYLNAKLYARIKKIWQERESLGLNPEQERLLERKLKSFARSGANLDYEQKFRLSDINSQLSVLSLKYGETPTNYLLKMKVTFPGSPMKLRRLPPMKQKRRDNRASGCSRCKTQA